MKAAPSFTRVHSWLAVMAAAAGLLLAAFGGLWAYMSATPPLHPDARSVPTRLVSAPDAAWAAAADEARGIVRAAVAEQNLPGLSVAIGAGDGIVWAEGFGWADLESRVPVTPETRFRIGTASTSLTSAAAGLLIEQGRLKLDKKIQTYVPEFPEKPWPVTLRHVMAHQAGSGATAATRHRCWRSRAHVWSKVSRPLRTRICCSSQARSIATRTTAGFW